MVCLGRQKCQKEILAKKEILLRTYTLAMIPARVLSSLLSQVGLGR